METEVKVFHSEISRVDCEKESHLYELLQIDPAQPSPQQPPSNKNDSWEFKPNYEKHFSPKRLQSKLKVKTVSEVRALFERDVYSHLPTDLELQQNYLLRKIRDGNANDEKTRKIANRLLNSDNPISRSSWQMLSNINPERHTQSKQFVLWNGKHIQVNGSKGGKHKFISNYDLKNKVKKSLRNVSKLKNSTLNLRRGLLRNSLNVKFKPGPLGKKMFLDASHHKYQMGNIELVQLPKPVLEVSPSYGMVLEPTISGFVNDLRGDKGVIPHKLAEFAASALRTTRNNTAAQYDERCCISFDLNYKCDQSRLLMRRNTSYGNTDDSNSNVNFKVKPIQISPDETVASTVSLEKYAQPVNDDPIFEVKLIMDKMLDSVEISLNQNSLYSKEDEPRDTVPDNSKDLIASKDKSKRKYCELDKLDVTIIKLPENPKTDYTKQCDKSFCSMGCVCESLDRVFSLKQHCGMLDCMFGCKCELSKYKNINLLEHDSSDILPGLLNLDNQINSHLAKEEQKFHQTVVFSGDKSIVLKSRKRDWKSSKRYAEFYSKMNLKGDEKVKKLVTVDIQRLNCESVEPLCMVHYLYKCFCKGKYTDTYVRNDSVLNTNRPLINENIKEQEINCSKTLINESTKADITNRGREIIRSLRKSYDSKKRESDFQKYNSNTDEDEISVACARTMGYHGRKYSEDYYIRTNKKIIDMEENDSLLKKKMLKLIAGQNISSPVETLNKSFESLDCETITNEHSESERKVLNMEENDSLLKKMLKPITDKNISSPVGTFNKMSELLCCETIINENSESQHVSENKIAKETVNEKRDDEKTESKIVNKDGENKVSPNITANRKGDLNYPFTNTEGKGSLKQWLETSYRSYRDRLMKGNFKHFLEAPRKGKASLQSWDFILSRYKDRKNIFVVSKYQPYRTFLAVDDKHPMFSNCLNIDDIRFADLPKYPIIIRNLVTNSTDSENAFCILRGWDNCWELIGSAVKVIEQPTGRVAEDMDFFDTSNNSLMANSSGNEDDETLEQDSLCDSLPSEDTDACSEMQQDTSSEKSKWFVLTIENDFTEIQFYKKGFFVSYEGIQRSITLARISGKTVRLSSRARTDTVPNAQPYGIYAIPCTNQSSVFIGPYEENEPLGIEIVKSVLDCNRQKKTRGVWINTNKVDNKNVIDNPLAYLPVESVQSETIPISNTDNVENPNVTTELDELGVKLNKKIPVRTKTVVKVVKPIKIRRTNGFYQLFSKNMFQQIGNPEIFVNRNSADTIKTADDLKQADVYSSTSNLQPIKEIALQKNVEEPSTSSVAYIKPVAEIAPQIKITHVYSESKCQVKLDTPTNYKGTDMLILKPEEINRKILESSAENDEVATDIEKFLEVSSVCVAPQDDVLVISDGEDDGGTSVGEVWIQCCNVDGFGYIRGRVDDDRISFEFPGFKYSEFYKEDEAFDKINQVLARKMYIPKNVQLQWQVVMEEKHLTCDLLTTKCLEDKKYLLIKLREQREKKSSPAKGFLTTSINDTAEVSTTLSEVTKPENSVKSYVNKTRGTVGATASKNEKMKIIEDLEKKSRQLEHQSSVLWDEAVMRRDEIFGSLSLSENIKMDMTETLQDIMSRNEQ